MKIIETKNYKTAQYQDPNLAPGTTDRMIEERFGDPGYRGKKEVVEIERGSEIFKVIVSYEFIPGDEWTAPQLTKFDIRKVMNSRGEDVTDFLIDKVEAEVRREIMSGLEGEGLPPMAE